MEFIKKHKTLITILAIWLGILFVIGIVSPAFHTYGPKKCGDRSYPAYYRWDSSWYTSIAQKGYTFSAEKNSSIAYWPLYPFTIKIAHVLTPIRLGFVSPFLSMLYAICAAFALFKLAMLDYSKKVSQKVVLVFLFFPAAYFFVSGYPESLFALLTILSFYFARKNQWEKAGIAAALLALTKPYGVVMIPTLLLEYAIANGWDWKVFWQKKTWWPLLLPVVSVFSFVAFNYWKFGNPLAFLATQKSWGRSLGNPFAALFWEAKDYVTPPSHLLTGSGFPYIIYFCSFFFFLWAMYISWSRVRKSYLLFTGLSMLTAFLTGTLTSWDRYMMISVASLIGIAVFLSEKKCLFWAYLIASGSLFIVLASLFVRCYPVE